MASVKDTIFSKSVLKAIQRPLNKAIIDGVKGSKTIKNEINKVLQQANRRIQNIENKGYASPAVSAVYAERGKKAGFTQFSIAGLNLNNENDYRRAKYEYARAMSFLANPTSTATGARQYIEYNRKMLGKDVSFEVANRVVKTVSDFEVSDSGYTNIYDYQKILENFRNDVMQVERNDKETTKEYEEQIENVIQGTIKALQQQASSYLDSFFKV